MTRTHRRPPRPRTLAAGAAASAIGVVAARAAESRLVDRWRAGAARVGPGADRKVALLDEATPHHLRTDDGAHLRVLEWGAGPPIVLLHGITASCEDWLPVVPHLVDAGHRVLAVDHRGHGASTLGTGACDTARLGADVAQVLEELDLRDAVVAGHSLGGYAALAAAALHRDLTRERVRALVLLGAPHTARGGPELSTLLSVAAPWTPRLQRSDPHGAVVMALVAFGDSPDPVAVDEVRYRWAGCAPSTRRRFARDLMGERLTPLLDRVQIPVVVARGTRDRIVTARRNRALVARLPHARGVAIDGAGHALLCERPQEVAGVILDATDRPA